MPSGFVAVASAGTNRITWSADGITWNLPSVGSSAAFVDVTHDGSQFVAVTTARRLWTSPTGDVWTNTGVDVFSGTGTTPSALHYANGRYLVTGGVTSLQWSTNLTSWTNATLPFTGSADGHRLAFGGGVWVCTKQTGSPTATADRVASSADNGATWTARGYPTTGAPPLSLTYGGGQFLYGASGSATARSATGTTWTAGTTGLTTIGRDLVYDRGVYVMVTDVADRVATSTDAISWTSRHTGGVALTSVATIGATLCAVGHDYCITSSTGTSWTVRTIPVGNWAALASAPVGVTPGGRRRRGLGIIRG